MFAKRLKELRTKKQISQSELAEKLNISNRTISMYEQGKSEPNVDVLIKMANYLGVTTDYLIGRTNVKSLKYDSLIETLGLSGHAISVLQKCHSANFDVSSFVENDIFPKLMEAYTEYSMFVNLPDPVESYEYGYDSFDMNDPFDVLQKNFLDHLQDIPTKEAYQVYLNSLFQKIINSVH